MGASLATGRRELLGAARATLAGVLFVVLAGWCVRAALERPATSLMFRDLLRDDVDAVLPLVATGVVGLLGAFLGWTRRMLAPLSDHPWWVALATVTVCAFVASASYQRQPLSMDEVAPIFQARVFASGQLSARLSPEQLPWLFGPHRLGVFFFAHPTTGQVVSAYWPGMALLLTPFEAVGAAFLVNPLLAGGAAWVMRHVAWRLTDGDREATGAAVLLLVASPCFTINGSSLFAMNAHLLANLGFVALLLQPASSKRSLAAGALGGFALALHNPFPHLLFAWPWWLLLLRAPDRIRRLGALAAGYVVVAVPLVVGWYVFAESLRARGGAVIGASAFTLPDISLLLTRALGLSKLVLWAPLLLLPLAIGGALGRRKPPETALVCSALSFVLAYLVVKFDQGHGWGYRYFQPAFATLPLLAALAIVRAEAPRRAALLGAVATGALASLLLLLPQRAVQVAKVVTSHRSELVRHDPGKECVHFIDPNGYYTADLIVNDPQLRGDLYLHDRGEHASAALRERFFPDVKLERRWRHDTTYCGSLDTFRQAALAAR